MYAIIGDLLEAKLHSIYLELQPEGSRRGSQNSAAGLGSIFHNLELAWKFHGNFCLKSNPKAD